MSWTSPKTWAVGDPATSADLNTYLRDNPSYLYGDTTWTAITAFTNGWGASGTPPGYIREGNVIRMRGALSAGTAGSAAFTLPYGPSENGHFAATNGATSVDVAVTAAGVVTPGTSTTVWLSGLTFSII